MKRSRLSEEGEAIRPTRPGPADSDRKAPPMLFVIVVLAALALWGVIVAVLAISHDGPGRGATAGPRSDEQPPAGDARFALR